MEGTRVSEFPARERARELVASSQMVKSMKQIALVRNWNAACLVKPRALAGWSVHENQKGPR